MPTQNPTVISASLDDSKLRDSIKSLVDFVKDKTTEMATSFDENVAKMEAATKRLGNALKGVTTDTKIGGTKSESQTIKQVADSYDALAKAKATAMGGGEVKTNWSVLKQYDDQLLQLRQRLIQVREDIDLYRQAIGSGKPTQVSWGQEGLKQAEKEAERLMLVITQLESKRGMLVDVLNPGNSFKNYIDNLTKVNPELAALNAQYKQGNTLLGTQVEVTQQLATAQSKVTNEINKQAQAIRESEKFQQTGMFSIKSGVDGSNREYFVYANSKQSIEEQLVWIKQEEIKLEEQLHGATKKTAQQLQEEEYAARRAALAGQQMAQALQAAQQAQSSGSKPTRFQDFENLQAAIDHVNSASKKRVQIVNEETAAYYKMQPALRYMQEAYHRLSLDQRNSDMGKNLADQIQRTQRAMQQLQAQMSRPVSFKAAMGLDESTLENIAYKMRQLASYRSGLDVNKQAGEIKQVSNELDRLRKKQDDLIGTNNRLTQSNNALSRSWNYMKNRLAFYFTVGASTQFVKNLIDIRSQYEMTERSLGILINSAERGTQIFNQLSDMALVSPYTLIELSNAAKQLIAYDVAAKDVVDTTRRLADIASAVGIPMERLTYALGQIKAYGYLNSRDARMFANAGIPLVKQLSEYYTQLEGRMVSIGDVYTRMKKKTIEYNDVMSVINKMTDDGGKFFDFQAKMAGTLKVQLANLTLAWNNMLNDIGKSNQGILATSVVALKELFLHWKDFDRVINSILRLGKIVGVIQAIRFVWLQMYKDMSAGLAMQAVAGKKVTAMLVGLRDGLVKIASSPVTWVAAIAFAFSDMYGTVQQANEAIKELNKSIRDGATESKKSLDSLLSSYDKLGTYALTTDQKTGRVVSATYTGSQDPDEMQKTWTAIREEIETSTAYGKVFMGQLVTETDLSKRLSKAFEITAKLRDVRGALEDIDESAIKVQQDMSAWWNLYEMDKGLINSLKEIAKHNYENTAFEILRKDDVSKYNDIFQDIKDAADETAKSISDTFSNLKFDPQQMREGFEEISNKIFEGKGLDPKTELQGRIELEKAFINQRKQMYIDAANEQARLGNQAQAEQIRASYNTWIKGFSQNQVLVNGFYDWLKSHHASELQSMFGNMTQDEINHIDWSKSKWQNWARENAQAFSKQMGTSFDDLWRWVQDASTWRVRIGVILDTTQIQKSVFETLSNADTKANEAYQHIKRLNDEITRLQGKSNRTKEENEKLTKAINERNVAQDDYNKAVADGGKSAKEASDANKSAAAARKAHAAATRAQRQAESELQKALKEELSIVDKIRNTYKDLRKAGVGTTEAIALATGGYEKSVKAINATLAKFGLEKFNPSKFAGIENPHELLNMFENQLNKLIASGKAKPAEIVELETKINEMKIDVKKFDIEKITKGLNSELDKLKDEYELAVELDANPELGGMFTDMFGIDTSTFPKTIDEYMQRAQQEFDKMREKRGFGEPLNIFKADDAKWESWGRNMGLVVDVLDENGNVIDKNTDALDKLTPKFKEAQNVAKKWAQDTIKQTQDLQYKLADINGKIAIEQKKLDNLRLLHQQETNEKQRHLLELMIKDQENAIDKLKQEILSTLPTYKRLFNSVVEHSARMTRQLAQNYKQMLELAVKKGKNSNGKYEVTDPISGQTAELTEKEMNAQLDKVNGKLRETQTSFDKIKEALTKGEDGLVDWVKGVELIADEAHKIADGISEIANIAEALGADEDVVEVINDIAASIDGLSTAAQGAAQIANGDIIGGTVNVVKGLWTTVSSWFDNSDKKITKKVKNSERAVKDLENAYKRLEYTVEHSMGAAETQARRAAIANKQLQLVELQRQLELEKSRKKKNQDIDRIKELEGAVIDAENDLKNLKEDVMNTLLGSDIKSAAEEFVDTWVQAWREGETTLDAIGEKMDDMIFNLIKKAATSKIVGNLLQPLYDMVDQYTSKGSEGGVELTTNELKALAVLSDKLGIDINNALGVFYGNLENLDIVSKNIKSNELSALQQGIQSITEDTASALEAYMNSVSQQVYLHSDLLMQIRDAVVAMDGDIQLSTQAQMLLQLQQSYQVQMAIQAILIGWSNPAGSAVKVELLN